MVLDRYSKVVLTMIALALAIIVFIQFKPTFVVAQETAAGTPAAAAGSYQVATPERDYAWVVTPSGYVWFCQSTFRGTEAGCEMISNVYP